MGTGRGRAMERSEERERGSDTEEGEEENSWEGMCEEKEEEVMAGGKREWEGEEG